MKRISFLLIALVCAVLSFGQAKYIFYMIGDGMGTNAVLLAEMYQAELEGRIGRVPTCMTQFPYSGQASTYSASNSITDSSAAGTCLATGKKTTNGYLGVTPEGKPLTTIAEILRDKGWSIGITTSVSIDHATPGAFYGKSSARSDYYLIGTQLAKTNFDFFGGGTFYQPYDKNDPNRANVYDLCEDNGYVFARGYKDYLEKRSKAEKMILIQPHEGLTKDYKGIGQLPYVIDRQPGDLSLIEITDAAINFLDAKQKPFFLMVEGGAIDWANHGNDAATAILEVQEFDAAIRQAYEFYMKHPDETLIVVTADHETGGVALGNNHYTLDLHLLKNQRVSQSKLSQEIKDLHKTYGKKLKWDMVKDIFKRDLGFYGAVEISAEEDAALQAIFAKMQKGKAEDVKTLYADLDQLANAAIALLNKKAQVGWTTNSHSASAVGVWAIGVGAENFTGWMDNSDIMPRLLKAAGM